MKRILALAGLAFVAFLASADPASAQQVSLDLGQGGALTDRLVQIVALITVLSVAPSILIMVTSFVRIVVVLSLLRTAIGIQQSPPNSVLVSLALFLTAFIMAPTFEKAYTDGIAPLMAEQIKPEEAFTKAVDPVKTFMLKQVREKDLTLFFGLAKVAPPAVAQETPLRILIPSFLISELRRAFEIGFLLFIPFLIIDMVVASVLMSMGMMMVSPVLVALPFKIMLFVLVDGWHMLIGSLAESFY